MHSTHVTAGAGHTLLELLFVMALLATTTAIALPLFADATDALRTSMAARYLAGRVAEARMEAIKRSRRVGLRFERSVPDYLFATYEDANGDGIRTADVRRGIDRPLTLPQYLADQFPGVRFGIMPGVPEIDGAASAEEGDGVRVGIANILTLGPDGTATPGTLYLHGKRQQYAVRVLGATARARVLYYDRGVRQWISR